MSILLARKLREWVNFSTLLTAYYKFLNSHLTYVLTFWGNSVSAGKAFKWQKKALRVMKNIPNRNGYQFSGN